MHSSRQNIGSKSAKNAVIYRGVAPSQAKNCVNTSVSAFKSGQNTAIYSVSCLPRFLEIATGIYSVLCISGPKSIGIYNIFCVCAWLPPTTLERKHVVIYSILLLPKSEKSPKKCVKTAFYPDFRTSKTHLQILPSFFPPRTPKNVKTPAE